MTETPPKVGALFKSYLALRPLLEPLMRREVARRVRKGKDAPARSPEKLGVASLPRPEGTVIWMHAVGLGEVLALRPLIEALRVRAPDVSFLITSTARSSGQVVAANLPPRTVHQFLPLDGPRFVAAFLDHWRPDLSVWAEQDLWPGAIYDTAKRGVPMAYINARLTDASFKKRRRLRGAFRDMMQMFALVTGQDARSVAHLQNLGAARARIVPSLKPAASPLSVDPDRLVELQPAFAARPTWVAASTHAPDEAVVLPAHQQILEADPSALLILVPRVPDRAREIAQSLQRHGLRHSIRSEGALPAAHDQVYLADGFGELGLWYRLAQAAFIGGSMAGGGHNPWEALILDCPVMAGPEVFNFAADYDRLRDAGLVAVIPGDASAPQALADATRRLWGDPQTAAVAALVQDARGAVDALAVDLLALLSD